MSTRFTPSTGHAQLTADGRSSGLFRSLMDVGDQTWEELGQHEPAYRDALAALYTHPWQRRALSERERALLLLTLDILVTQLRPDRADEGIQRALDAGATLREVTCAVQLIAVIGLHSISFGVPRLFASLDGAGSSPMRQDWTPQQLKIKERFETTGPRSRTLDGLFASILRADPDYFEKFVALLDIPWASDALAPREKQMICIAIDACCSHLYEEGLLRHYDEGLAVGLTSEEIVEVLQICSITGLRTLESVLPPLMERIAAHATKA